MTFNPRRCLFVFIALAVMIPGAAIAHDYKIASLEIAHPWARATPKGAKVGAAYLKITNAGKDVDRLVSASADFAARIEAHEMTTTKGVMQMRPVPHGVEIKPGQTVELKPGGLHLMLLDLKQPLEQGQRVKGRLTFEKAGSVDVEFAIESVGGAPKAHHSPHSGH